MNDYEFETLLKRTFKQDCVSPFENRIDNLIGDMYSKKNKRKKMLLFIPTMLLISSAVFAMSYRSFNLSNVGINESGINLAMENGYIKQVDTPIQEYNDLGIKVDNFLMNDFDFDISFNFVNNNLNIKDIENIQFTDLHIYDENNNTIFISQPITNLVDKLPISYIAGGYGYTDMEAVSQNEFTTTFFAWANEFPKSKTIFVEFNTVLLHCKNSDYHVNGEWKFKIDVPDYMVNRQYITYSCTSNNVDEDKFVRNLKLTNTSLILEIYSKEYMFNTSKNMYIIANGKKYKPNDYVLGTHTNENGVEKHIYLFSFNLTSYDAPEEITLIYRNNSKKENRILFIKNKIEP